MESGETMESSFKTTMFGGFERQSVIDYIEKAAHEAAEEQEKLRRENEELSAAKAALEQELAALRKQVSDLDQKASRLTGELERTSADCEARTQEAEALKPRVEALTAEAERLRPEAEAYARVKAHIGEIECSAQKRADELEASVTARMSRLVADCERQYRELTTAFDVASGHVLGELRKVEVNLSQLPRTFDKMGSDLAELEAVLQKE